MLTADILSALSPTLKITGLLLHKFHLNMSHKVKVEVPVVPPLLISSLFTTHSPRLFRCRVDNCRVLRWVTHVYSAGQADNKKITEKSCDAHLLQMQNTKHY